MVESVQRNENKVMEGGVYYFHFISLHTYTWYCCKEDGKHQCDLELTTLSIAFGSDCYTGMGLYQGPQLLPFIDSS